MLWDFSYIPPNLISLTLSFLSRGLSLISNEKSAPIQINTSSFFLLKLGEDCKKFKMLFLIMFFYFSHLHDSRSPQKLIKSKISKTVCSNI